jgi:riboflavin biosynthesis pyrimidine reductase
MSRSGLRRIGEEARALRQAVEAGPEGHGRRGGPARPESLGVLPPRAQSRATIASVRQLLPVPVDDVDLESVYAYPSDGPWLRANMVATVDGSTTDPEGVSGGISGEIDKTVFRLLRQLSDVILVGATTVRVEGYRSADKPIAVVSRSLELDFSSSLFAEADSPTVLITCAAAPGPRLDRAREVGDVVVCGDLEVDLALAVQALVQRGHQRLLTEGGPTLLAGLVEADVLDELDLTISPMLVAGHARRLIDGPLLTPPRHLSLQTLIEEQDILFARYVRAGSP